MPVFFPIVSFLLYLQLHAFVEREAVDDAEKAVCHLDFAIQLCYGTCLSHIKQHTLLCIGCRIQWWEKLERWA